MAMFFHTCGPHPGVCGVSTNLICKFLILENGLSARHGSSGFLRKVTFLSLEAGNESLISVQGLDLPSFFLFDLLL